MVKKILLGAILASMVNLFAQQEKSFMKEPVTVQSVDLKKYTGLWYEIAKIPNWFQKKCVKNTTAFYKTNSNGSISVVNSCINEDGEQTKAEGTARVVDKVSNAKLEVSFVSLFGINLFWGDYWIIGLDENYTFAIIGTPNRKYGWILNREPQMTKENLEKAFAILRNQGYNPNDFIMTTQQY